jgi:hypothetical protein
VRNQKHDSEAVFCLPQLSQPAAPGYGSPVTPHGILGWKGDAETLERIALDPEFLPEEAP